MKIQKKHIFLLIILLAAFVTNINTIGNEYSLDDYLVVNNERVESGWEGIVTILTTPYDDENKVTEYRPIGQLTYWIEYSILQNHNPQVSHFVQLILYIILLCLVYHLLLRITNIEIAFAAGLLFALHPLHTEVVASLKNREEILAMLFGILALWSSIQFFDLNRKKYLFFAFVLYTIALFSKLSAFPFLLVIPFYGYLFCRDKSKKISSLVWSTTLMFFAFVIRAVVHIIIVGEKREFSFYENPLAEATDISVHISAVFYTISYYTKLFFVPYPLRHYYGFDQIPILDPPFFLVLLGIFIGVICLYVIVKKHKENSILAFNFFWIAVFMTPFINIIVFPGIISERATFIASLGFTSILAMVGYRYLPRKAFWFVLFLISLVYAGYSFDRNFDWKDELTLYSADAPVLEKAVLPNYWYAKELRDAAALPENIDQRDSLLTLAIERCYNVLNEEEHFGALLVLGNIELYDYKNPTKALAFYERALPLGNEDERILYEYALANMQLNNLQIAEEYFKKTIEIFPESFMSYYYLFQLFYLKGEMDAALNYNKEILKYSPDTDYYYLNVGTYHSWAGNMDSAVVYYDIAVDNGCRDAGLIDLLMQYHSDKNNLSRVEDLERLF